MGHEEAGRKGAVLFSLVATCRELGIDPKMYLQDVLTRLTSCSDVRQLTPHGWKEHFAAVASRRREDLLARLAASSR